MGIAFFDMDYTVLSKSSSLLYVKYLWQRRMLSLRELKDVMLVSAQYSMNILDFTRATVRLSRAVRGGDAAATQALFDQFVPGSVIEHIAPRAVQKIREHQIQGDHAVLISASPQFVVKLVAQHLGMEPRSTELEVGQDGKLTGGLVGEPCYGDGKRMWGEQIATTRGVPLNDCWFYSDSYSDHFLLDVVGHPIAVNPDPRLKTYAQQKRWPIEYFY